MKSIDTGSVASRYFEVGDILVGAEINGNYHSFTAKYHAEELLLDIIIGDSVVYHVERGGLEIKITLTFTESNYVKIK